MSAIYLNLGDDDTKKYIYRIVSLCRLYELFSQRKNTLVHPNKWGDPFENFILKSSMKFPDGNVEKGRLWSDVYGQCWTLHSASDAMWRIYSPNADAVRMRTSIDKLAHSLAVALPNPEEEPTRTGKAFIGKVQYYSNKALLEFPGKLFSNGVNLSTVGKSLLVKRTAFRHEREVRLLCFNAGFQPTSDTFSYSIDPHNIIDQIMIDPRLSVEDAESIKGEIRGKTGFAGPIKRSLLYEPPAQMIIDIRKARLSDA